MLAAWLVLKLNLKRTEPSIFFFFSFFGNADPKGQVLFHGARNYKASGDTRGAMSSGQKSNNICSSLPEFAFLAKKWATEPSLYSLYKLF